jgi:hypothetical protein
VDTGVERGGQEDEGDDHRESEGAEPPEEEGAIMDGGGALAEELGSCPTGDGVLALDGWYRQLNRLSGLGRHKIE